MTPFDYIKSINSKNYIENVDLDKEYTQYVVNTGFSYFMDTVLICNEINKYQTDNLRHYDFLYYMIRKQNRFSKWNKKNKEDDEIINLLCEIYNVNKITAKEYMVILNEDQIKELKKLKGGKNE